MLYIILVVITFLGALTGLVLWAGIGITHVIRERRRYYARLCVGNTGRWPSRAVK